MGDFMPRSSSTGSKWFQVLFNVILVRDYRIDNVGPITIVGCSIHEW